MATVRQLFELQSVEDDLRKVRQALQLNQARSNDATALEAAQSQLQVALRQAEALRRDQRDMELQLQSAEAKIREIERKLYGGSVTSPKELLAFQEELRLLKERKGALEDRLLEAMLLGEEGQRVLTAAQDHLTQVLRQRQEQVPLLTQERDRLTAETAALEQKSRELRTLLPADQLQLYEVLKASREGQAVVRVERGICRGCGVALPSQELQRVRIGRELLRCKSCGRILYGE
jgi:predicted  nucleic acid-binding Zn-ribbon protein